MTVFFPNIGSDLRLLYSYLSSRRRAQLLLLICLMFVGVFAEMATLGTVVPFLAILADPELSVRYPLLRSLLAHVGLPSDKLLLVAAGLFSVLAVGSGAIRLLLTYCSLRFGYGLGADLSGEIYRRTLYQPYGWHVSKNSSEILSGVEKVNTVIEGIVLPLLQGVVGVAMSLGILALLFWIDAQTALIAGAGFGLLYAAATFVLRRRLGRNSQTITEASTLRVQAIQEGLGGIRDVLLDGTQSIYHQRFADFDYACRRAQAANNFFGFAPRYVIESAGMVLIVGLTYWLAGRGGGLTGAIPVLGALAIGGQKLLPQMQLVYASWSFSRGNSHQLRDVLDLLSHPVPREESVPNDHSASVGSSEACLSERPLIALRGVCFQYSPGMAKVLQGIDLYISRGSRVGFVGKTGSGKSTLIDLVMGLLEPTEGVIEIDGVRLTAVNRRMWQRRIAHVPQTIYLADTTFAENIAFGVPAKKIDLARVRGAAQQAQIAEFIENLPQQYRTTVGERGVRLSGGQKQRIGLARALYKNADVLVLDEATSALDDATQSSAMDAIWSLRPDLTILVIAHRVHTLKHCDVVVELAEGRIARIGDYGSQIVDSEPQFSKNLPGKGPCM